MNTANSLIKCITTKVDYYRSSSTMFYADWRSGATIDEKRCYNVSDRILLSYDDSIDQNNLTELLILLKKYDVKVIFFLIGSWAEQNHKMVDDMRAHGHWIGNHTATHQNLTKISDEAVRREIRGGVNSSLLRPPYGAYNARVKKIASDMGYKIANWSIDTEDWKGLSVEQIQTRVFRNLAPGACILLHLNSKLLIGTLPVLIEGIRKRGFELCTIGDEITT